MVVSRSVVVFVLSALVLLAGPSTPAQTEYQGVREHAMRQLGAQLQADQLAAARDSLRSYLDRRPGDAVMQYNLACLDALSGAEDQALARLRTALAAGYRDLERLQSDPDLATLHDDPRLAAFLKDFRSQRLEEMHRAHVWLQEGRWSEWQVLRPEPAAPGTDAPAGSLRLRYDTRKLVLEITPAPGGAQAALITLTRPPSLEVYTSDRWYELRAPLGDQEAVELIGRDGERPRPARRETGGRVARVDAAGAAAAQEATWRVTIPWQDLQPNRPPLELLLGLNVTLRRTPEDSDGIASRWWLVRDVFAGSHSRPRRAFVPVSFDPGLDPEPILAGRLDRYVSVADTMSVEYGIQGLPGGEIQLALTASSGEVFVTGRQTVVGDPGLTYATMLQDIGELPRGWVTYQATVTGPDGMRLSWSDRGYRLAPDWFLEHHARLGELPAAEATILQYVLFRVLRGQQAADTDTDPAPLVDAVARTESLLARWDRHGTVLPTAAGMFDAAFALNEESLHPCTLVLPEREAREEAEVVVVLTDDPDASARLAAALAANGGSTPPRIHVVLTAPPEAGNPRVGAGTALRAADWATELFAAPSARLSGFGAAAASALRAATLRPSLWSEILLVPAPDFDPWVLSPPTATARMVGMTLGPLPVTLVPPENPTARARSLFAALGDRLAGLAVADRPHPADRPDERAGLLRAWR